MIIKMNAQAESLKQLMAQFKVPGGETSSVLSVAAASVAPVSKKSASGFVSTTGEDAKDFIRF